MEAFREATGFIHNELLNIPENTGRNALIGGLVSFTFVTVFTANPVLGAAAGATAALATVVDALVNPLFEEHFAEYGTYSWGAKTLKNIVSISIAGAIGACIFPLRFDYFSTALIIIIANAIFSPRRVPAHSTSIYII